MILDYQLHHKDCDKLEGGTFPCDCDGPKRLEAIVSSVDVLLDEAHVMLGNNLVGTIYEDLQRAVQR